MKITYTEDHFVANFTEDYKYIKTVTARIDDLPVLQVDFYRGKYVQNWPDEEPQIAAVIHHMNNCNDLNSLAEIHKHMAEVQKLLENNIDTNE